MKLLTILSPRFSPVAMLVEPHLRLSPFRVQLLS